MTAIEDLVYDGYPHLAAELEAIKSIFYSYRQYKIRLSFRPEFVP